MDILTLHLKVSDTYVNIQTLKRVNLPGRDGSHVIRGVEDPTGGEGVGGAGLRQALPREVD